MLAAAALVSAFPSGPVSAQGKLIGQGIGNYATNDNQDAASEKDPKKTPKGLATKKGPQAMTIVGGPRLQF